MLPDDDPLGALVPELEVGQPRQVQRSGSKAVQPSAEQSVPVSKQPEELEDEIPLLELVVTTVPELLEIGQPRQVQRSGSKAVQPSAEQSVPVSEQPEELEDKTSPLELVVLIVPELLEGQSRHSQRSGSKAVQPSAAQSAPVSEQPEELEDKISPLELVVTVPELELVAKISPLELLVLVMPELVGAGVPPALVNVKVPELVVCL